MVTKSNKTLDELFHDTLKDIYYAEKKILSSLPKMAKAAQSPELKAAFEKHERETEGQVDRLEKVFETLSQLRTVDVVLPTRQGVEIRRRCVERPDPHQAILLQRLGMHPPDSLPLYEM